MDRTFDFSLRTSRRCELLSISASVRTALTKSGIRHGLCVVAVPHTTAGIIVNENADPDVCADILSHLERIVPRSPGFLHAEGNADAHIKAVMTGSSVTIPVRDGALLLGTWQGIFFAEFDGPRARSFHVDLVES
jgi:secondary thiamine-phosphate synthase enzyme